MSSWRELPIAAEWDDEANGPIAEFEGPAKSKVQWRCKVDTRHYWEAEIAARISTGSGCPVCVNQKIVPGVNDLATSDPQIASMLNEELSGFLAKEISRGNNRKTGYWSCPKHPSYLAVTTIFQMVNRGCPVCSGRQIVSGYNDMKTLCPELMTEWHTEKNVGLDPKKLSPGTGKKIWWVCQKDSSHEWQATGDRRFRNGSGCPYCKNQKVKMGQTDLLSQNPTLADYWDSARNGLRASEVFYGSQKKRYWWRCLEGEGHSFEASIPYLSKTNQCLICTGKQFQSGINDLASVNPKLASEWHPSKNMPVQSSDVSPTSDKKYWWMCSKDSRHIWQAPIRPRHVKNIGCPICGNDWVLKGVNDLATTRPDLLASWEFSLNTKTPPTSVTRRSKKKVWWRCQKDQSHVWEATIYSQDDGKGCLYCTGQLVESGKNDLASRFPDIATQWNYQKNFGVTPDEIFARSGKTYWWRCTKHHEHEWRATVANRTRNWEFTCPYCIGKKLLTGFNDLETVYPEVAALWHQKKNTKSPTEVLNGTHSKFWWECPKDPKHLWYAPVVSLVSGTRCPSCSSAGFDQTQKGILYYIYHPELEAKKVGITNNENERSRTEAFKKAGWTIKKIVGPMPGTVILELETLLLRWIRNDLKLPPFLDASQMKSTAGWSETFSAEGVSDARVLKKIEELLTHIGSRGLEFPLL